MTGRMLGSFSSPGLLVYSRGSLFRSTPSGFSAPLLRLLKGSSLMCELWMCSFWSSSSNLLGFSDAAQVVRRGTEEDVREHSTGEIKGGGDDDQTGSASCGDVKGCGGDGEVDSTVGRPASAGESGAPHLGGSSAGGDETSLILESSQYKETGNYYLGTRDQLQAETVSHESGVKIFVPPTGYVLPADFNGEKFGLDTATGKCHKVKDTGTYFHRCRNSYTIKFRKLTEDDDETVRNSQTKWGAHEQVVLLVKPEKDDTTMIWGKEKADFAYWKTDLGWDADDTKNAFFQMACNRFSYIDGNYNYDSGYSVSDWHKPDALGYGPEGLEDGFWTGDAGDLLRIVWYPSDANPPGAIWISSYNCPGWGPQAAAGAWTPAPTPAWSWTPAPTPAWSWTPAPTPAWTPAPTPWWATPTPTPATPGCQQLLGVNEECFPMNMRNCCSSGMKCYGYGGLYPNYALCMSYCSSDYWEGAACNLLGSGSASTSFLQSNDEEDVDLSARGLQGPPAVPGRTSSEGPGSMIAPGLPEQKATAAGADETEQQHAPPHPAVPELLVVSSGENQEGVLLV